MAIALAIAAFAAGIAGPTRHGVVAKGRAGQLDRSRSQVDAAPLGGAAATALAAVVAFPVGLAGAVGTRAGLLADPADGLVAADDATDKGQAGAQEVNAAALGVLTRLPGHSRVCLGT